MTKDRASDTALLIARSILLAEATASLRVLLPAESARLTRQLLAAAAPTGWFEFCLRHRWTRAMLFALERFFLPGIFLHYLVRKHRIAALTAEAIEQGCGQLIVLGAGLDTLAWRQALLSQTPSFELDHPATQAIKHQSFRGQIRVPFLISADLTHDSPAARLRDDAAFDPTCPCVFVAEGLLMYLSPARVSEVMGELAALAARGSRFVFTFMETRPNQPLAFHNARSAVNTWLRARQEPFRWGLARADVSEFARRHGWQLTHLSSPDELRATVLSAHGLANAPLALGESIALLTKSHL
jgi:methyltransferase (TIGR00027 family)